MKISKKVANRIKTYSAMGTALLGTEATAAIVYTDVSPDFNGGTTSTYMLDLNNDSINDFQIFGVSSSSSSSSSTLAKLFISPLTSGNAALGSYGTFYFGYPYALNSNDNIGPSASGSWLTNSYQSMNYTGDYGNWIGVTDKYIGLKIVVGGNTYYGWCRMDVSADGSTWVVKDYAYENTPNTPIAAGDMGSPVVVKAGGVSNISGMDVGNALDGTDLEISFDAAADETTVDTYRVLAVKSTNAAGFDLATAQAVPSSNYLTISPNGSATYTQSFAATGTDVDGDAITNNQPYKIFVLSIADGTNATADSLSGPSAEISLINDMSLNESGNLDVQLYGYEKTIVADLNNLASPQAELTILNLDGKIIYSETLSSGSRYNIQLDDQSVGIYIAVLKANETTLTRKVMLN